MKVLYLNKGRKGDEVVKTYLLKHSFEVQEIRSLEQLKDSLSFQPFDLVLTDLDLFGFSDVEILKLLRSLAPDVPVVVLTGRGSEEVAVKALKEGAADYLTPTQETLQALGKILHAARERTLRLMEHERLLGIFHRVVEAFSRAMEYRDPYTSGHQRRVAELACAVAERMGLDGYLREGLRVAGLLHDVGKSLVVPMEILSKPGKLSEAEFALIKMHPKAGYDILSPVDFPWPVAEAVYQHHERLDGSGYPRGLKGEEIIPEARILAVADVVEAMTSHRPYRPALGLEEALGEIKGGKGKLYDPEAVEACLKVFEEGFPFSQD